MLEMLQLITIALCFDRALIFAEPFRMLLYSIVAFESPDSAFEAFNLVYENESLAMQ